MRCVRAAAWVVTAVLMATAVTPAEAQGARPAQRRLDASSPGVAYYRIQAGDTLWGLARRYRTTPERLAAMNGIALESTIRIGQRLKVPAVPAAGGPQAKADAVGQSARTSVLPSRGQKWALALTGLAMRYVGVRYRWGGNSPAGFDCSGFLHYVYAQNGVALPRTTFAMFDSGVPVPREALQPGDIVFFQTLRPGPSHAGIYLGDERFVHSSSGSGRVTITPMTHRYYGPRYLGARRF